MNRTSIEQQIGRINDRLEELADDDSADSIAEQEALIEQERELREAARPVRTIRGHGDTLSAENRD